MSDNLTSNHDLLVGLVHPYFTDVIDAKYENTAREQSNKLLNEADMSTVLKTEADRRIHAFTLKLMYDISKEVYGVLREQTLDILYQDIKALLVGLFTDTEAGEAYKFFSSSTGRKILRNLDLVRESYQKSLYTLNLETMRALTMPEVMDAIAQFSEQEYKKQNGSEPDWENWNVE